MTVREKESPIGHYLYEQIKACWDKDPLSGVTTEIVGFVEASEPADQAEFAFDAIKKLMGATLVEDGLCVGLLENWKKLERILYATDEQYRDHFLHPFNTYLIGLVIGKHMGILNESDLEAWQYAAFFHDVGYPVEKAKAISESIRETYFKSIPEFTISDIQVTVPQSVLIGDRHDCISQIARCFVGNSGGGYESGEPMAEAIFQEGLLNNDHGVVSAIIFWNFAFLDALPIQRGNTLPIIREAVTAMALHNLHWRFPGLRVRKDKLPLAFLLALCDELQEWGRPSIDQLFSSSRKEDLPDGNEWRFLSDLEIEKGSESLKITFHTRNGREKRREQLIKNIEHLFLKVFLPKPEVKEEFKLSVDSSEFRVITESGKYVCVVSER